jgi:hypothetical protein
LELLHTALELRATPKYSFALRSCGYEFFTLHVNNLAGFAHSPLGLSHTAFELGTSDLGVCEFLPTRFEFRTDFGQITLCIPNLRFERIERQLQIDDLGLNNGFQLATRGGTENESRKGKDGHRPPGNCAEATATPSLSARR